MKKITLLLLPIILMLTSCDYIMNLWPGSEPTQMKLALPKDSDEDKATADSADLTVIMGKDHEYFYYEAHLKDAIKHKNTVELRKLIAALNQSHKNELKIAIKPSKYSDYKDVVDVLDEMTISNIQRYVLVDMNHEEAKFIESMSK
jgi:biopolymer transport protein ExbD